MARPDETGPEAHEPREPTQTQITMLLRQLIPFYRLQVLAELAETFCFSCGYERRPGESMCPCRRIDA